MAEDPKIHDGVLGGEFPDQKGDEAEGGDDGQAQDERAFEPVQILALVEHDLQGAHEGDQQRQSHEIDGLSLSRGFLPGEGAPGEKATDRGHRHIDKEDP